MLAMIRVIYRWDVEADARDNFIQEWRRMTEWIRSEFDGACGSTLVEPMDATESLVGIARWTSPEHLAAFRENAGSLHLPGATLTSMEILTEIVHLTTEVEPS